ncbi:efflux RND transporter permease subunit, partial [Klebsiella pneumoniae]|uniref:efflux RND transporter permease subunit n=1 Tax=Klebsiella pneumoniae TaxID=573 RepID=UPI0037203620
LDLALRFRRVTLGIFLVSLAATIALFVIIPKGFFPQQDTGLIVGQSEAAQDISFQDMQRKQEKLGAIIQQDPAVASAAMAIGGGGGNSMNTGRFFITLKPRDERDVNADQIIARLRPKLEAVEGARLYLQAAQDVRIGRRISRTQYQ